MTAAQGALGLGIVLTLRDEVSKGLDKIRAKMQGFEGVSKDMVDNFDSGAKRMLGGIGLVVGGAKIISAAFGEPLAAAVRFESVMADVNKVADFTNQQYKEMSAALVEMSTRIPMAAEGLGEIMAAAAQAGIAKEDLVAFTEDAAKMGVAFGISAQEAGDAMAGLRSIFDISQNQVVSLGDAVNHLSNNMNATASDILNFLNRAGGIGRQAGMSAQQIAALGSTFIDLKTPPETASRAVASLIMKLTTASTAGKDAQTAFESLGLTGAGMEKAFKKDASGAITAFLDAVNKSKDPIGALKAIVGEGFADDIAKLASGNEKLKKALEMVGVESQYAGSMLEEYETRAKTVENAQQILNNRLEAMKLRLGNVALPIYGKLVSFLGLIALWLGKLPEPAYQVIAAVAAFSGISLILFGALMMVGGAVKMWPVFMRAAQAGLLAVRQAAVLTTTTLLRMAIPVLALVALSYAARRAWEKNFGGIRDFVTAIVAGFNMAVAAGTDGISKVDAATAKKLQELGLWDFAVTAGKVFYRVRLFLLGLLEGFKAFWGSLKTGYIILREIFDPVLSRGKDLLGIFGLMDGAASSNSKSWKEWGEILGKWIPLIFGVVAAFKIATLAVKVFNLVCGMNPTLRIATLVIGAIALMIYHWDFFGGYVKAIWNGIVQLISGIALFFSGIWKMICGIWQGDIDLFKEGFTSVFEGLKGVVQGWVNFANALIAPILDGINWVLEKMGIIDSKRHNQALVETVEKMDIPATAKQELLGIADTVDADTARQMNKQFMAYTPPARDPQAAPLAATSLKGASAQNARALATMAQTAGQIPVVQTEANVTVEPSKTDVYLDNVKIGEAVTRWQGKQNVRMGRG